MKSNVQYKYNLLNGYFQLSSFMSLIIWLYGPGSIIKWTESLSLPLTWRHYLVFSLCFLATCCSSVMNTSMIFNVSIVENFFCAMQALNKILSQSIFSPKAKSYLYKLQLRNFSIMILVHFIKSLNDKDEDVDKDKVCSLIYNSPVFTRTSWLALSAFVSFIRRNRSRTIFWSSWNNEIISKDRDELIQNL